MTLEDLEQLERLNIAQVVNQCFRQQRLEQVLSPEDEMLVLKLFNYFPHIINLAREALEVREVEK